MQDKFFIFNDGLKAWWEKEAQEHLHGLGFRDRQLCCLDPTNQHLAAYRNKVAGDSFEIYRGLDSQRFCRSASKYHFSYKFYVLRATATIMIPEYLRRKLRMRYCRRCSVAGK